MECACFSTDNDEYVTMLASKHRRAVKHHRCSECLGTIFPGQTYLEERYLYDGTVSTHKTCACCESVSKHLFCQFTYSELWFNLRDFLGDLISDDPDGAPWAKIAKLTPTARTHVLLMIEEIWQDVEDEEDDH